METRPNRKSEPSDLELIDLISQFESSQMSTAEICEYQDIDLATLERWHKRHYKLKNPKGSFKRVDPFAGSASSSPDTIYAEMILPGGIIFRLTSPLEASFIKALI